MGIRQIKLVSGGQTGADRAALDFALEHKLPHGGWSPAGRLAEDGPISTRYQLSETPEASYLQRTEWNVRDSDGTVVLSLKPELRGGSRETVRLAREQRKPVLHLFQRGGSASPEKELRQFLIAHRIQVLNVAGPRASEEPQVGTFVRRVLARALRTSPAPRVVPGTRRAGRARL